MLKKITSIVVLLLLCLSFLLPANAPALAATKQQANTIILEVSADKDDIYDFRRGEGKIFKRVRNVIEHLKEEGSVDENAQPVIAIVQKKKSSSKGLLD